MLTTAQKEQVRIAVLVYLAERHPLAFDNVTIARMIKRNNFLDFPAAQEDIDSAIAMLKSAGFVENGRESSLGATIPFAATAQGLIHAEREGLV